MKGNVKIIVYSAVATYALLWLYMNNATVYDFIGDGAGNKFGLGR